MRKIQDETMLKMVEDGILQKKIAEHFGVSPAAVCKRLKRLTPLPDSFQNLTEKEKIFVTARSKGVTQTQAALEAYECSSLESAKAIGNQLMKKPAVKLAIQDIMDLAGLTREYRVMKLKNHVDHRDPNVSLKALDQSWKLSGEYLEREVEAALTYREIIEQEKEIDREILKIEAELRGEDIIDAEVQKQEDSKKYIGKS